MVDSKSEIVVYSGSDRGALVTRGEPVTARNAPAIVKAAGRSAEFAWEEFFQAEIANAHTRKNYLHAVQKFLAWVEGRGLELAADHPRRRRRVPPGLELASRPRSSTWRPCGDSSIGSSTATPASSTRRRPSRPSATPSSKARRRRSTPTGRTLLKSIDVSNLVGLRDRAILAVLVYTAARVGAVAKLTLKSFKHDGTQYSLRFSEKGGKSREIPVRHDLEKLLLEYIEAAKITDGRLFRTAVPQDEDAHQERDDRDRHLPHDEAAAEGGWAPRPLLAPLVPRHDHHRPARAQRPLEDVQHLAGHADPRTTRLYDRRRRKVTRNIVERISV